MNTTSRLWLARTWSSLNRFHHGSIHHPPCLPPPSHPTADFKNARPIGNPSSCAPTTTLILSQSCATITLSPPTPLTCLHQEAAKSFSLSYSWAPISPLPRDHLLRSGHFGSLCTTSLNRKRIFCPAAAFFSRGSFRIPRHAFYMRFCRSLQRRGTHPLAGRYSISQKRQGVESRTRMVNCGLKSPDKNPPQKEKKKTRLKSPPCVFPFWGFLYLFPSFHGGSLFGIIHPPCLFFPLLPSLLLSQLLSWLCFSFSDQTIFRLGTPQGGQTSGLCCLLG